MDPLSLSVSDLHHHEYTDFTPCFADLMTVIESANDPEKFAVPLVLARSFVHGRYPKLSLAILDRILRPYGDQDKTIGRGEFFAILRLVHRELHGKGMSYIFRDDTIDNLIEEECKSLRMVVEKFLNSPEPPTWDPPPFATNHEFLASLRLPTYRNGNPSLLFHDLDMCDGAEIERIFRGVKDVCICNTSGSGKTRRMLECLTKKWGFYLVVARDLNGVGVGDLLDAIDGASKCPEWVMDLGTLPPANWVGQSEVNSRIATRYIKKVLAARVVVFEVFLALVIQVDGSLQERHKRIWLLFQLFDNIDPHTKHLHPFKLIMDCLDHASPEYLDRLVERLDAICRRHLPGENFIVELDEAQHAVRNYPRCFVSSGNNTKHRSILREMVKVFNKAPMKIVVSGTGMSMEDLEGDFIASGVSKPFVPNEGWTTELGMFDNWPKLKVFLERYLPPSFLETASGHRLQQRIQEYLLGRYRFSVSFLEYLLRNGLNSPHTLLNEYIKGRTSCLPGDCGDDFISEERPLQIPVNITGFEWHRLQKDPVGLQQAALVVHSHLTKGESPTFGQTIPQLVEYGIARLCSNHKGQIVEPLAFLSLLKWLETQPTLTLEAGLQIQLGTEFSRGDDYEQLVILYLHRALQHPTRLSAIFKFHGAVPLWADKPTQIIGYINKTPVAVDILGEALSFQAPQNLGLSVVQYAANISEVIEWIENPTTAVLVPTILFGPDVLVWCDDVLLMGQVKSYTTGNEDSLDAQTITHALTSLHPDHWFEKSKPDERVKLIHAIQQHRVLRFLGGYPLPPNLNLTAPSVRKALAAFGPDVVLATIKFDTFRAKFIAQGQVRNVLEPLEAALKRKQGADEMSS